MRSSLTNTTVLLRCGHLQLTSLESKAKKQEEMYRAEKTALEASMADKVG